MYLGTLLTVPYSSVAVSRYLHYTIPGLHLQRRAIWNQRMEFHYRGTGFILTCSTSWRGTGAFAGRNTVQIECSKICHGRLKLSALSRGGGATSTISPRYLLSFIFPLPFPYFSWNTPSLRITSHANIDARSFE